MKIRIKFAKTGSMKYIGHLDIMRFFQKAMRRSGMPIKYSEGFSPHQIMSFAAPLGIGLESCGEYMDITLRDDAPLITSAEGMRMLNTAMCPGMEILSFRRLPDDAKNAMSMVAAADYSVCFSGEGTEDAEVWASRLAEAAEALGERKEILIEKENKKGETVVSDIKPYIYSLRTEGTTLFMHVSQGSEHNIRPEFVIKALLKEEKLLQYESLNYAITRHDLFSADGLRLEDFGETIE